MESLNDILAGNRKGPCLSLYQPTHRSHPEKQQDPVRFRNLVKMLEQSLRTQYPDRDAAALLAPFNALASDERFWNHALDALAVLGAPGLFRVYRLQRPVDELAVAADSFHVKPLLRILQSADRFHVLGLSRQKVTLFEGNRDALDEVELDPAVPRTLADALERERKAPHFSVWTYHAGAAGPQAGAAVQHGQGGEKTEEVERDTEKFFRAVDRAILEKHSRPSGLALLLAALPEHHGHFRRLSRNPFLLADGIDVHPDSLSSNELRQRAWRVRLDDVGELALKNGGQVVIVPAARMPTRTGIAAIYRY